MAPTRIYTYGLPLGPTDGADLVDEQMRLARRYQHALIDIECARRRAIIAETDAHGAGRCAELEKTVSDLYERRKQAKLAEDKALIKALNAELKVPRADLAALRAEIRANAALKEKVAEINEKSRDMIRRHRKVCSVYWGTYLLVERAMSVSCDRPLRDKYGNLWFPKHRRWDGRGKVGVQLQNGMTVDELFSGKDTRLQIAPVPAETWTGTRSQRRRLSRTTVRIRVGSNGRAPIWATFPVILHRPLPPDAVVKWAWAQRKRIGTRLRWELQLTIQSATFVAKEPRGDVCAIDIGWRLREDGIRVGALVDTAGEQQELQLPKRIVERLVHADHIRGIRDTNMDEIKARLILWLDEAEDVPEPLRKHLTHLGQWRSTARLASVASRWSRERFDGDEEIFAELDAWRRQNRHLYQWESNERSRALGHRREHYRILATQLARRYGTVLLEDIDLRKLAKRGEDELHQAARHQRTLAAISEFRDALKLAASNHGAEIVLVPAFRTTSTCHHCGAQCTWDRNDLHHACQKCDTVWDQDDNAAKNMLAGYFASAEAAE